MPVQTARGSRRAVPRGGGGRPLRRARPCHTGASPSGSPPFLWGRVPTKALVDFTRSFAVMMRARLPLVQSLETAAAQCQHTRLRTVIEQVRRDVQRGGSLASSLARHEHIFSNLYVHLVGIGEVAGLLDEVLLRLATHLEKASALKRKVQFALFYPGLILTVAVGAIAFFLTTIVPTFAEMYADFGHQLPGPTQVVLAVSSVLTDYALVAALIVIALCLGTGSVLRTPHGRLAWDRATFSIPLVGALLRRSMTARYCRTLGTLLSSGVALVESLEILAKSVENTFVAKALSQVVARVRRGSSLYQPLQQMNFFPDMVVQLIAVGEETAELDAMLLHAANHYEQEVDGLLDGLTAIIEPVLIVIIGLILGSILVSLYLPMFELINTVG